MTDWSLTEQDSYDFLDPNDPTSSPVDRPGGESSSDGSSGATTSGVRTTTAADLDPADLSDAISDPSGAVHVWVDADRRLLHVRLSNRWRERLMTVGQPKSSAPADVKLDQVVLSVLRRAQSRVTAGLDVPRATEDVAAMSRNDASLAYLLERSMAVRDRRRKLEAKPAEEIRRRRVVGQRPVGHSAGRQVSVTLDVYANTVKVTLDEGWLSSVKTADLGPAIVDAHRAAYEQWTPPAVEPGEYEELAREGEILASEAAAMLRRGA